MKDREQRSKSINDRLLTAINDNKAVENKCVSFNPQNDDFIESLK